MIDDILSSDLYRNSNIALRHDPLCPKMETSYSQLHELGDYPGEQGGKGSLRDVTCM